MGGKRAGGPAVTQAIGRPPGHSPGQGGAAGADDVGRQGTGGARPSKPAPGLYLVATPIGNARDITLRALDLLTGADLIACEDTRVTGRLLQLYGLRTPMVPYHEHNAARQRPLLMARLGAGAAIALVSDAGTPLISDPGFRLVGDAVAAGHLVTAVPGPSSVLAALTLAGLPTDRFFFAGFLPPKSGARRAALAALAAVPSTLVFLESAQRLQAMLTDAGAVLGDRPAAVARELTKLFEEVRRQPLTGLAAHYAEAGPPKGEVVVVIGGPSAEPAEIDPAALDDALVEALAQAAPAQAAAAVAAAFGLPRRQVYQRALALKGRL